jgi:hypothetical protein
MSNVLTVAQKSLIADRLEKATALSEFRVNGEFSVHICEDKNGAFGVTTMTLNQVMDPQIGIYTSIAEDKKVELLDDVKTYEDEFSAASYLYSAFVEMIEIRYAQNIIDGKVKLSEEHDELVTIASSIDTLAKAIEQAVIKLPPMQSDICLMLPHVKNLQDLANHSLEEASFKCSKYAEALASYKSSVSVKQQ